MHAVTEMSLQQRTIKLVADPYPPYQFKENHLIKGIDYEIIRSSFSEHNIKITVELLPWDMCMNSIRRKEADGIFQIVRTPEREALVLFSDPLRTASTFFLRRADTDITIQSDAGLQSQLKDALVGVLSGYSYNPDIDGLEKTREYQSQEGLLQALTGNEVDLIVMDSGVAYHLMNTMNVKNIERVPGYEITRELHVAFLKDKEELKDLFNIGLRSIREKGVYREIFRKYGVPEI